MLEWYRARAGVDDVMRDTEQLVAAGDGRPVRLGERTRRRAVRRSSASRSATPSRASPAGREATTREAGEPRRGPLLPTLVDQRRARARARSIAPSSSSTTPRRRRRSRARSPRTRGSPSASSSTSPASSCATASASSSTRWSSARGSSATSDARRERGLPVYPHRRAVPRRARRGVPPSGGNALGLDRLVALACGTTEIADVIAFTADEV